MEKTTAVLRKWGNSFGVIIPSEIVANKNLKEGSQLELTIEPKDRMTVGDLMKLGGKMRLKKVNVQKALDEIDRELWPEDE